MASSPSLVDTIEETCTSNRRPRVRSPSSDPPDKSFDLNEGPVEVTILDRASSRSSRSHPVKRDNEFVDQYIESGRGLNDLFDLRADFRSDSSDKAKGKRDKPNEATTLEQSKHTFRKTGISRSGMGS